MSAFNMGTYVWYEGWLTRLRDNTWLIPPFQSRWVKRFFVLRGEGFADTKRYFLDEYKEESKRHLIKTHDLDRCDQVDSYLELSNSSCVNSFEVLKWIFSIHLSKPYSHKKSEVYFAAKEEIEMREWVQNLCRLCHLERQPDQSAPNPYSFNENEVPLLFNDMSVSSGRSMDSLLDPPLSDVTSESRTGKNQHVKAMTYLHMKNAKGRMGPRSAIELRTIQRKTNCSSRHNRTCSSASGCSLSSSHQSATTEDDASSVHSTQSTTTGIPTVPPRSRLKKQPSITSSTQGPKASLSEAGSTMFSRGLTNGHGSGETIKANSCNLSLPRSNLNLASPVNKGTYSKQSLSASCLTFPSHNDGSEGPPIDRSKKPPNLRIEVDDDRTYGNTSILNRPVVKMPYARKKTLEHPKSAGPLSSRKDLDYFEPRSTSIALERNAKSTDASNSTELEYIIIDAPATQTFKLLAHSRGNGDA